MFGSTMMLTIGQALDRAMNEGTTIRINIAGEWMIGQVKNTDSQSVVMTDENGDLCVLRMDAIACVHIPLDEAAPVIPTQATGSPAQADVSA